ncbi:fimbrial chaperone protein, partial [Pseudomonas gingeri]|nr:fimbrial chaperone protein [Pseudomonas gingeri]
MTPLRSKPAVRHSLSLGLLSLVLSCSALADGMVPETSVVIVHEAEGEAAVSVTNT